MSSADAANHWAMVPMDTMHKVMNPRVVQREDSRGPGRIASACICRIASCLIGFGLILGNQAPWLQHAQAHVYATHVRLTATASGGSGSRVEIRYILNEPATAGVVVEVLDQNTVVRRLTLASGEMGTRRGENFVIWDGRSDSGNPVCCGSYRVRIITASHGYPTWTLISHDLDPGQYVYAPSGIAVIRNPDSPYYGRVLVANSRVGPNALFVPGDRLGILKFHADGSEASEGSWSDAGWDWAGDGQSPAELETAPEGWLYVMDRVGSRILRLDPEANTTSLGIAWDAAWWPWLHAGVTGFALSSGASGPWLWVGLSTETVSSGVYGWVRDQQGVAAREDPGHLVVRARLGSDLVGAPSDVAVSSQGALWVTQWRIAAGDPTPRVLRFPVWTNGSPAWEAAVWSVGQAQDTMRGATALALDPTGRYLAVAFRGAPSMGRYIGGRVMVFNAATGEWVATLPGVGHEYTDVDWDAVGNLYVANASESVWRVYSPPGSNAAVTLSAYTVRLGEDRVRPVLQALGYERDAIVLALRGQPNTSYSLESSSDLLQWRELIRVALGAETSQTLRVPTSEPQQFYRARSSP